MKWWKKINYDKIKKQPEVLNPPHEYGIKIYFRVPAVVKIEKSLKKRINNNDDDDDNTEVRINFTSPWLAPFTNPAMSTNSIDAATARWDLLRSESLWRRGSGTATTPTFGSIVQKGKLAAWAFPFSTYEGKTIINNERQVWLM